jgi:hypothetical protein
MPSRPGRINVDFKRVLVRMETTTRRIFDHWCGGG